MIMARTKLQNEILGQLAMWGEMSGHRLREKLNEHRILGVPWWLRWWRHVRLGKFIVEMTQLENAGLILGWYVTDEVFGHELRWYCKRAEAFAGRTES